MKKIIEKEVATLDEFSEDEQRKIYENNSNFNEDIIQLMNNEMTDTLYAFMNDYGVELSKWNVDEDDYDFTFDYDNIYNTLNRKGLRAFISEKYKEVQGYITIYADNHLIDGIKEYLESNEDTDFITLMKKCLDRFFSSWQKGIQFYKSFESFKADCISNEIYFDVVTKQSVML